MNKKIELSGRIDSNNAEEVEKKIIDDIGENNGEIILDAAKLEYISSAGLRMILSIKKKHDNTKVINCNSEVYEIFDMTGFTQMIEINRSLREISIDNCEIMGEGFYGTVYRIDPETIVKVYKMPDSLDMVKRERELSKTAFVLGIPTAIAYDIVKVGDKYGSVFELLNCKSLDKIIQEGESIEKIADECVKILKKIHETEVNTNELPNRKDKILETAEECKEYFDENTFDKLLNFIKGIEDRNTMLHGDFQIKNLMKQGDDILIIDMDTLSYGNPIFEFAGIYASYIAFACVNKNNPIDFLGISYEKTCSLWENIFNKYHSNMNDKEKSKYLEKIKILSYLQVLFIRSKFEDDTNKFRNEEIEFAKNYIIENINKI